MANKKSRKLLLLEELSEGFTRRSISREYMDDPEARRVYGEYFGAVGFEKGWALSQEILERQKEFAVDKNKLSIVDLGTGTGEFIRGICSGLEDPSHFEIELCCVDRSSDALQEFKESMYRENGMALSIESAVLPENMDWIDRRGSIELCTMGNLLAENEDCLPGFVNLLGRLYEKLSPGGLFVLVEPADRRSSRSLLTLGDHLRNRCPGLHILGPCPNNRKGGCPALSDPEDWCHEDRPFDFSSMVKKTAQSLGHVKDSLKMTYLIMSRDIPSAHFEPPLLRLVSPLNKEKGMAWGIFCDGVSRLRIRLLNRKKNDLNRSFVRLRRGDAILCPPAYEAVRDSEKASDFLDWPADSPVVKMTYPDGALWNPSEEEE